MSQKWNLQDIRPAEPRRRTSKNPPQMVRRESVHVEQKEDIPTIEIESGKKTRRTRWIIASLVFFVVFGGLIALSAFLSQTTLTVIPQLREPNINAEFVAYPDRRADAVTYEILNLEATGERQVTATGQEQVDTQAKGVIEIRKSTPGTERLIKNTRFRSPEGRVFRIQESVVVPGAVDTGEGGLIPGTIQAEVFADEAGEEYNLPAGTTFDVPGYQEGGFDGLYQAVTATNPEEFTGGFSGPRFIIAEEELQTARQALQVELRDTLLTRLENEKPAGFITFPGAISMTFSQQPAERYGDNLVTIKEQAILHLPLFKADEFATFLAEQTIATYAGNPVRIENPDTLTFSYTEIETSASVLANLPSLRFNLTGRPTIVWEFDLDQLQSDLAGKPKTAINTVLTGYPGIESAQASVKPFWRRTFPDNPEDIVVIEVLDGEDVE
jgi:hypothetical protein